MKVCTLVVLKDGRLVSIEDVSIVHDDHEYGLDEEGRLHIEGSLSDRDK